METLKASQIRKGDKLFIVQSWNHNYSFPKKEDGVKENGKWVYTPHTNDSFQISPVTVYSCGKKQMILADDKGFKGEFFNVDENGTFYNRHFVKTKEDAEKLVKELFESNKNTYAITYSIVYN